MGGQGNVFRSPVILHNAGQIRLELTAEDIQLDCACHSVASIRASPHAFVFAISTRENTARSVFLCHFHLCRPLALDFLIMFIIECYMLNIDITGACTFLIHIVHFSDAITSSDLKNVFHPQMSLILKKQVSGDHSHVMFFFAGRPAVHAAVTLACSPMMREDKVLKK